jgi:hypothetical protein
VPEHEVSAQPRVAPQRAFEVDALLYQQVAQRHPQRLGREIELAAIG